MTEEKHLYTNICHTSNPTTAILLNKDTIATNIEGNNSIPTLSQQAANTIFFPKLNYSLSLLGQLCDDNCIATLTKHNLIAKKNNQIILKGKNSISGDKLWDIHLPQQKYQNYNISYPAPTQHSLNIILRKRHMISSHIYMQLAFHHLNQPSLKQYK